MDMITQELARLRTRADELRNRIIPEFENKTQMLFAQIMPMDKESEERQRLEAEFDLLSKELRLRSDELIKIRQEMENLETQKSMRR